jgi:plasmid stabilization system protein ParE
MRIKLTVDFNYDLRDIVDFIAKDKPIAAKKFKKELLANLKKDLKYPFHYKVSIYSDGDENVRDYVFKGYTVVYKVNVELEFVSVVAILKHRNSF